MTACWLALEHGWAINIGGGFHHASSDSGGGFCVYADISLAATILFEGGLVERIMVVDCDAHQVRYRSLSAILQLETAENALFD